MKTSIGVMARAPLLGRCKTRLLAAHGAEWVTGLCGAMLRDTLDGLQSVPADDYVVFVAPVPPAPGEDATDETRTELAFDVLARHVPSPWRLVAQRGDDLGACVEHAFATMFERGPSYALLTRSDAPSFPTEPLAAAVASETTRSQIVIGPREDGGHYVLGMPRVLPELLRGIPWRTQEVMETTRQRCQDLALSLHELPRWYGVDEPADVLALLDEMRSHPDRAPRTAQFLIKNA
jgi:uncharacterized protein